MAVVFDVAGDNAVIPTTATTANLSTGSMAVSVSATLAVVMIRNTSNGITLNSVKFGGVDMIPSVANTLNARIFSYYLFNPPTGSQVATVNWTDSSGGHTISIWAATYTGAGGSAPDNTASGNTGGADVTLPISITPVIDNCLIIGGFTGSNGNTPTSITNATIRIVNQGAMGDTSTPIHPAAATTLTANYSGGTQSAGVLLSFAPYAFTKSASASIGVGAGRAMTVNKGLTPGSISVTMAIAAGRAMTAVRNWPRSVSLTMMNAAGRLLTAVFHDPSWTLPSKPSTTWTDQNKP